MLAIKWLHEIIIVFNYVRCSWFGHIYYCNIVILSLFFYLFCNVVFSNLAIILFHFAMLMTYGDDDFSEDDDFSNHDGVSAMMMTSAMMMMIILHPNVQLKKIWGFCWRHFRWRHFWLSHFWWSKTGCPFTTSSRPVNAIWKTKQSINRQNPDFNQVWMNELLIRKIHPQ